MKFNTFVKNTVLISIKDILFIVDLLLLILYIVFMKVYADIISFPAKASSILVSPMTDLVQYKAQNICSNILMNG